MLEIREGIYLWELFRHDSLGCNGYRRTHLREIDSAGDRLQGLDTVQLWKITGRPDDNYAKTASSINYIFWLEPSAQCLGDKNDSMDIAYFNIKIVYGLVKNAGVDIP